MIKVPDNIKGLIFDCDGTLADTMPVHYEAWKKAIEELGREFPRDFIDSMKGAPVDVIIKLYNEKYDDNLDVEEFAEKKDHYALEKLKFVKPIEPVAEVARKYKGILPMAVVSGGREISVRTTLKAIDMEDFFPVVITANSGFKPKPDPEMFLKAAELLNMKPENCMVFEDGDYGLEAAKDARMLAFDVRPITGQD